MSKAHGDPVSQKSNSSCSCYLYDSWSQPEARTAALVYIALPQPQPVLYFSSKNPPAGWSDTNKNHQQPHTDDWLLCLSLSFIFQVCSAPGWNLGLSEVHLSHLCRKQAHFLANFNWFLFVFNHRIINILKRYQPNKLPRKKAETFLKRLCL